LSDSPAGMRQYVDLSVLANLVSMMRAEIDGAMWIADDDEEARFYELIAHESGKVVPAPGMAVPLLKSLQDRKIEGLVATVRVLPGAQAPAGDNVFSPSLGDVASLLISSTSSYRVIVDACGTAWMTAGEKEGGPVRERAIWIARILRRLRDTCLEANVPPLEESKIPDYIRWDIFEIAWDRLYVVLIGRGVPPSSLEPARETPSTTDSRIALLECDGMDVVRLLAYATHFYHPRGISAHRVVDPYDLLALLRVAYDLAEIEPDPLFWRLQRWQRQNMRYPLLRKWRDLDPLGVVLNQRYWESDLSYILQFLDPDEPMTALKADLDNFKRVNEALGHTSGDEAIRLYCTLFKKVFEKCGEIYRRGGDEVIALAPGLSHDLAHQLAEELRALTEAEFKRWSAERGLSSYPTASIGVVLAGAGVTAKDICLMLDEAQGQAKLRGKNCVVFLKVPLPNPVGPPET
jgi:diguanylate cyclase (GGDEF)-like protein